MFDRSAITDELIRETDSRMASSNESPEKHGLQSLPFEQQEAVLDWVESHCEPSKHVRGNNTSKLAASYCTKALREGGYRKRVTNLAMKSALDICGYEASVPSAVEIQYYRMRLSKEPIERKEAD